jgi:CheY-like chemotaxis protein
MRTIRSIRVLIVEDDPLTLEALTVYLRDNKHDVCTAGNGLGAKVALAAFRPDVLVTDHIMPAINGLDFIKEIRQEPCYSDLPTVVITALADGEELDDLRRSMEALEPIRLLRKPFYPYQLLEAIREMPRSQYILRDESKCAGDLLTSNLLPARPGETEQWKPTMPVTPPAAGYHKHRCHFCAFVWDHHDCNDVKHGDGGAHECPHCGRCNWSLGVYSGPEPAVMRNGEDPGQPAPGSYSPVLMHPDQLEEQR